jgi:hypothetical protein
VHIDDLVLTLDLGEVTLALAASTHQIEAYNHIEYFDGDSACRLASWRLW